MAGTCLYLVLFLIIFSMTAISKVKIIHAKHPSNVQTIMKMYCHILTILSLISTISDFWLTIETSAFYSHSRHMTLNNIDIRLKSLNRLVSVRAPWFFLLWGRIWSSKILTVTPSYLNYDQFSCRIWKSWGGISVRTAAILRRDSVQFLCLHDTNAGISPCYSPRHLPSTPSQFIVILPITYVAASVIK